ncbi:cell wall-binding protein [Clostridium beijerinckii]|nr:cell wall-binding protein [Clostridium beijerinckii]
MNNNLKKIIAFTIICTAFSTWVPSTIHIGNQYAYAYSDNKLTSLKISSGISGIGIYSSKSYKSDYKIKSGDKVPLVSYSKIPSNQTNIKLNLIETNAADTRGFVGNDSLKLTDIYSSIKIEKGEKKSIYIRLYDSKNSTDDEYTIEYKLIVEREDNGEDDSELETEIVTTQDYDDIYLNKLLLYSNNEIINFTFDKSQSIYNINVDENKTYFKIKAVPEQESYDLFINDKEVDTKGDNKYTKEISLDKGINIIKIRIKSEDYERREYFLNVTRGKTKSVTAQTNTTNKTTVPTTDNNSPQNIQIGAAWQYRKADGTMAIGWTSIANEWYYFDSTGALKTGWLQDTTGKWYYLNESGVMAKDTMIAGYKLGSDGVCIIK